MVKRILFFLLFGLLYIFSLLPFRILYWIADLLYLLLNYGLDYRRAVIDQNLLNAFPEKTSEERRLIRIKFYRYLADLIVETVKLLSISPGETSKRMRAVNPEILNEMFAGGHSVLGVLGHYGNWELGALAFSQLIEERRIIVYKPLSNTSFDRLMRQMRSRFGATLVSMQGIARRLIAYQHERSMTVLVSDQTPAKQEIQYFTSFLNQPTAVFLGVEKLAKLTNSVVLFCDIRRLKRGYYECTFVPLFLEPRLTDVYEITNAHVQYLEKVIRQQPELWLWSHRRWKYKPEN